MDTLYRLPSGQWIELASVRRIDSTPAEVQVFIGPVYLAVPFESHETALAYADELAKLVNGVAQFDGWHSHRVSVAPFNFEKGSFLETRTEAELSALGLLPTTECPVFYRTLGKSAFGLFLYLERGLDLQTLRRLGESSDLVATLQDGLAGNRT